MTPVQSQPIGQSLLAAPGSAGSGRPPAGSLVSPDERAFSAIRPSIDGVRTSGCERRPFPSPLAGGPPPDAPGGALPSPATQTPGSTGNSFLDLISQLMSQLDSVITGLTGGTTAPAQPDPGSVTSQPELGDGAMRRLLGTGEVA